MSERIQAAGPSHAEPGIKDRALEAAATARESLGSGFQTVRKYIVKEPARALGLALGVGVLLGWLVKRR